MNKDEDLKVNHFWNQLYIEMLANPTDNRSDVEFCKDLGIPDSTLKNWKSKNRRAIYDDVNRLRKDYVNELRSKVWKSLAQKMKTSKGVDSEKLIAQLTGDLVERTENKTTFMTYEQKLARIEALNKNVKDKSKAWERVRSVPEGEASASGDVQVSPSQPGAGPAEDPSTPGAV